MFYTKYGRGYFSLNVSHFLGHPLYRNILLSLSLSFDSWDYFCHDQSRQRAYRWGEDGLLGITDRECRLCFALALWNEKDAILKERLFGLTGPQGIFC